MSTAHMSLVVQFRILHCDISVNNTMIYVCDTPESEAEEAFGNEESLHGDESRDDDGNPSDGPGDEPPCNTKYLRDGNEDSQAPGDDTSDSRKEGALGQSLTWWERQRREQTRAGILCSSLLVDFDYATNLDQALPVVSGDHTISILLFCTPPRSLILIREQYRLCRPKFFSITRKKR